MSYMPQAQMARSALPLREMKEAPTLAPIPPQDYYPFNLGPRKLGERLSTDIFVLRDIQASKMYYARLDEDSRTFRLGYEVDLSKSAGDTNITLPKGGMSIYDYTTGLKDFLGRVEISEQSIKKPLAFKLGVTPLLSIETTVKVEQAEAKTTLQKGPLEVKVQIVSIISNFADKELAVVFSLPSVASMGTIINIDKPIDRVQDGEQQYLRTVPKGKSEFKVNIVLHKAVPAAVYPMVTYTAMA